MTQNKQTERKSESMAVQNWSLPPITRSPWLLCVAHVLPQIILLIINLRTYDLIVGEVDEEQKRICIYFFVGQLFLLLSGVGIVLLYLKKKSPVPWAINWGTLALAVSYLSLFCFYGIKAIPEDLQRWIVPFESLLFYQFCFVVPSGFLAALNLACFRCSLTKGKDFVLSLAVALAIPFFWYVVLQVGNGFSSVPAVVIMLFGAASSLLFITGMIRFLSWTAIWAFGKGQVGQVILISLFAVVAPIGGLLLNSNVEFPANFQSWIVYVLTIVNGVVLTIPHLNRPQWDRVIWLAQCVTFPFTLYFFLVFLPFLPFAVLAIVAAGAGFFDPDTYDSIPTPFVSIVSRGGLLCEEEPCVDWYIRSASRSSLSLFRGLARQESAR